MTSLARIKKKLIKIKKRGFVLALPKLSLLSIVLFLAPHIYFLSPGSYQSWLIFYLIILCFLYIKEHFLCFLAESFEEGKLLQKTFWGMSFSDAVEKAYERKYGRRLDKDGLRIARRIVRRRRRASKIDQRKYISWIVLLGVFMTADAVLKSYGAY